MSSKDKNLSEYNFKNIKIKKDVKIGIVVSEWNSEITEALYKGAFDTLVKLGVDKKNIIKKYVPGSFELPLGAKYLIDYTKVHTVICIGCVIQGETKHFDFICDSIANGIQMLNIETKVPVIFGVLTTNNLQQAKDRAGGKYGNKGIEASVTAIKMITLKSELMVNKLKCNL